MKLKKIAKKIYRKLLKKPYIKDKRYPAYWFNRVLGKQAAFLVQIGSNDGKTGDPLFPLLQKNKQWKALFVEPVPYLFQRLKKNYPDTSRFQFENVAINDGQSLEFHWVDPIIKEKEKDLPFWFDQIGSFNKQHIINELDGRLSPYIISEKLEGITLPTLFERHQVNQFEILHIDAESYDWIILSQLNQKKHMPSFILYEHNHLSKTDLQASFNFLNPNYQLFKIGIDVLAVHQKVGHRTLTEMKKVLKQQ